MSMVSTLGGRLLSAGCIVVASMGTASSWVHAKEPGGTAAADEKEARKDRARRLWQEGLEAARAENPGLALVRFRESQALYPHVGTLRNLGVVEVAFDEYAADGANHLAYYLAHATDLPADERQTVEALLAKTEKKVGRLDIDINPPGAALEIDGKRLEPPLTKRMLYVAPGRHETKAWLPDSDPVERQIEVGAGESERLAMTLDANARSAPLPSQAQPSARPALNERVGISKDEQWPEPKLWAVVGGGVLTVVASGVGIYGHLAHSRARNDARAAAARVDDASDQAEPCSDPAGAELAPCRKLESAMSDQDSSARLATGGWIATGVFAAATAAMWIWWPNETRGRSGLLTAPWLSSREAGWTVTGRF